MLLAKPRLVVRSTASVSCVATSPESYKSDSTESGWLEFSGRRPPSASGASVRAGGVKAQPSYAAAANDTEIQEKMHTLESNLALATQKESEVTQVCYSPARASASNACSTLRPITSLHVRLLTRGTG